MNKFDKPQFRIDKPERSKLLKKAWEMAGKQIQEQFSRFNKEIINSSFDGFKWIKTELTYPSADHISFAYKSDIFSVFLDISDDLNKSFDERSKYRLLDFCQKNNLVPCVFKFEAREKQSNSFSKLNDLELVPLSLGWNLYHAETNQKIEPNVDASEELTPMSAWELNNFAIQVVRSDIEKHPYKLLSLCDLLNINPQIWFEDEKGNVNWVVVKYAPEDEFDFHKWIGLERNAKQLRAYDGYFAGVDFWSHRSNSPTDLCRGDQMSAKYMGLQRVYVA